MVQRRLDVSVGEITRKEKADPKKIISELDDWRVSDVTIGYLKSEAKIGQTLTVAFGFTNLTDWDVTLKFSHTQRISISIVDDAGKKVYESPAGTGPGGKETIKATAGTYWTEKVLLDAGRFQAGSNYTIQGTLKCDVPFAASIQLLIAA